MNPWLQIPLTDYRAHMAFVGQELLLKEKFHFYYHRFKPRRIAMLGCTDGNEIGCIGEPGTVVTAVDINPAYLQAMRDTFPHHCTLITVEADLTHYRLPPHESDLVYAALIFEYLPLQSTLNGIASALTGDGKLVTILQVKDALLHPVSASPFNSLQSLSSLMHLVEAADFESAATAAGLVLLESNVVVLPSGKRFYCAVHMLK